MRFDEPVSRLYDLLDLVVVSIASDIVPVTGENRVLAYYGLKRLNSNPSIGLKTLINISGIGETEISVNDIVFKIGPRLNAAGRIEHGKKSVELLVSTDQDEAIRKCDEINSFNEIRKSLDRDITQEALDMINLSEKMSSRKSTVLYNRDWHKGVVGIVASRLTDWFYRPTVILTESNGMATGSARSIKDFDLYEAIDYCSDLLESYGGHMFAAGLTLKLENVKKFSDRFEEFVQKNITQKQQIQTIDVDTKLQLTDITPKFVREDFLDSGTSKKVGQNEDHIKLELVEPNSSSIKFPGIAFSQAEKFPLIESGLPFDVCYSITENEFRGRTTIQMLIRDIKKR
jgi:single-stranded-DNA-specific exonuclease